MATGTQKFITNVGMISGGNGKTYVLICKDEDSGDMYPVVIWRKQADGTALTAPKLHIVAVESFKDFIKLKTGTASPLLDFDQLVDGDKYADASGYVTVSNLTDLSATKFVYPTDETAAAKYFSMKGDGVTDETIATLQLADDNGDGTPDAGTGNGNSGTGSKALLGIDFTGKLDFLKTKSLTGVGKYWDSFVSFVEKNPLIVGGVVIIGWKPVIMPAFKKLKKIFK